MPIFRLEKGLYSDCWLTDDDILQVRVLSDWSRRAFASFGALAAIFGIIYLLVGSGLFVLFFVMTFVLLGGVFAATRSRRRKLSHLTPEELVEQRRISRRIAWVQVSSAEIKRGRLAIKWDNRTMGLIVRKGDVSAVQEFLRVKMGERLSLGA